MNLLNQEGAVIVDVREPAEYQMSHVVGSQNIPLRQVSERLEEIRIMSRPLILIGASGNRSGRAAIFLKGNGLKGIYNGGGVRTVKAIKR